MPSSRTRSTKGEDFSIDVCQECHPFYTGKQKVVDTGGRIDRFNKRWWSNHLKIEYVQKPLS